jgi:RHS repeat-associated protein
MKMKQIILAVLATAILLSHRAWADNSLPAALPEFMDQQQLAKWSSSQAASTTASEVSTQFYTGKPYVADAGGYVFKYRTYNPEMSRWTSADPSGFPDGVNNYLYAPHPGNQVDATGLNTSIDNTSPGVNGPTTASSSSGGHTYTVTDLALTTPGLPAANTTMTSLSGYAGTSAYTFVSDPTSVSVTVNDNYAENTNSPTLGSGEGIYFYITATGGTGADHFLNIVTYNGGSAHSDHVEGSHPYTYQSGNGDQAKGPGTYTDYSSIPWSSISPGQTITWLGTLYILQSSSGSNYNVIGEMTYSYKVTEE